MAPWALYAAALGATVHAGVFVTDVAFRPPKARGHCAEGAGGETQSFHSLTIRTLEAPSATVERDAAVR